MGDIQFYRGYVNAQEAAAGRFSATAKAPEAASASGAGTARSDAAETDENEFSFSDFLDVINPLQHIPVVSTLYRAITGDEISAPARVFGGTLYGGPTGFLGAVANLLVDEVAGQDAGASVLALFDGGAEDAEAVAVAPEKAAPATVAPTTVAPAGFPLPPGVFNAPPLITAADGEPAAARAMAPGTPTGAPAGFVPAAFGASPHSLTPAPSPVGADRSRAHRTEDGWAEEHDGLLTGQAALDALFNDLSPAAAPIPPGPAPADPAAAAGTAAGNAAPPAPATGKGSDGGGVGGRSRAADPTGESIDLAAAEPGAHPLLQAADAPDAALAEQMLMALDKYRAMAGQQRRTDDGQPSGPLPAYPANR
ncbi:hypothetical protein [Pelagibius sp.]|uniref:hypothetical protein n=1 Tax=Pelagibius sp. TaxID=1931238 RepID=UPI0026199314|nr:hypothetical protein [Pelagibius sp.]